MNISFIGIAYFGRHLGSTVLLCSMIPTSFLLVGLLKYVKKVPATLVIAKSFHPITEVADHSSTKVVPLKSEVAVAE
jgi:hypothetical protein